MPKTNQDRFDRSAKVGEDVVEQDGSWTVVQDSAKQGRQPATRHAGNTDLSTIHVRAGFQLVPDSEAHPTLAGPAQASPE